MIQKIEFLKTEIAKSEVPAQPPNFSVLLACCIVPCETPKLSLIGESMSKPHTSELNCNICGIYRFVCFLTLQFNTTVRFSCNLHSIRQLALR